MRQKSLNKNFVLALSALLVCNQCLAENTDSDLVNTERLVMETLVLESAPIPAPKKKNQVQKHTNTAVAPKNEAQTQPIATTVNVKKETKTVKSTARVVKTKSIEEKTRAETQDTSKQINAEVANLISENAKLIDENTKLKNDLEVAKLKISELNEEVDTTRSDLVIAETELNRLSALTPIKVAKRNQVIPEIRNDKKAMLASANGPSDTLIQTNDSAMPERGAPYPVGTVSVALAELRLGPGSSHPVLTKLPEGSRVAVEMRKGEWYRVFSPAGERAWIHSGSVVFGDKVSPLNDSSASRVKGYKSSAEDRAFQELLGR